ncbi:MAG: DUF998 domain-containing protein [Candidatus Methanomethylophilaceae archaeon]|jgi:hypothetical membrane protein
MKCCKASGSVLGGIGLIAVLAFTLAWLFASLIDTTWIFGVDMLSDLGVSDTDAKYFFNYGCMIAGLLILIFGAYGTALNESVGHQIASILLIFAGIMLMGIGLFPENTDYHTPIGYALIVFTFCSMISMTASDWRLGHLVPGGVAVVLIVVVLWYVAFEPVGAMVETVAVICGLIWLAVQGCKFILE